MRWTIHIEGGPMRVNHAAVGIGHKIYSFGGYSSSDDYKDWEPIPVHVLDTRTLRWAVVSYKKDDALIPFQRYGHTAVAYGHKVYMWGGRNNSVACDVVYCFDTVNLSWSAPKVEGTKPYAKDGHTACIIKNKMYIFGGFEYNAEQYSQETHSFNLDTFEWRLIHPDGIAPLHRDFHTAVAIDNRMYIFGGRGDLLLPANSQEEMYCPQLFYLDTDKSKWFMPNPVGLWPPGRRSHSAWVHDGCMYIFGGFNGETKTHFNDLYRYSAKTNQWQLINVKGCIPCKRRRQACVIYNNKMHLFGGTSPNIKELPEPNDLPLTDNSDLHILDYYPSLKTLTILAVVEMKLDYSVLPRNIQSEIRKMTQPNRISRPANRAG